MEIEKILLPIDGSETCQVAYEYARDLGEKYNAKTYILHIQKDLGHPEGSKEMDFDVNELIRKYSEVEGDLDKLDQEDIELHIDKYTKKILNNAKKYFDEKKVEAETKVLQGRPANKIIDFAEKENVDLIVMCTHGMSGLKRFTMGSTTNKVVHHSSIPVLIIR